jgi:hypothetical protein
MEGQLFSRLDGRGGSTIVVNHNKAEAKKIYSRFWGEGETEAGIDAKGHRSVHFVGPEPEEEGKELLIEYGGEYHVIASEDRVLLFIHKSVLPEEASFEEKEAIMEEEIGGFPQEADLGDVFGCIYLTK